MAGYSGTPLPKKLGMLPGTTVFFDGGTLEIPGVTRAARLGRDVDVVHLFTKSAAELGKKLAHYRKRLRDECLPRSGWAIEDHLPLLAQEIFRIDARLAGGRSPPHSIPGSERAEGRASGRTPRARGEDTRILGERRLGTS